MRHARFSIVLAVLAVGCDTAPPPGVAASRTAARRPPRAPKAACRTLAPAPPGRAAAEPAPLASSAIAVNLPVPLAAVQPEIDRLIPGLSDPDWNTPHKVADGMCATWFFDRQPIGLRMDGPRLRITIPGGFGMIAGPHTDLFGCTRPLVSCGDKTAGAAPIAVQVRLSTALLLTPDYRIGAALQNDGTVFVQPCNVMGNFVNATPAIEGIIDGMIRQQLAALNAAIAGKTDFRPRIEAAWSAIQRPQKVGDDLWLVVHPGELEGAVSAAGPDTVSVQAVARGTVELVKQPSAPAAAATPLPALAPAAPGGSPGVHVGIAGSISYDELSKQLQSQLAGAQHDIEYPAGVKHHIVVRDVRATGPVRCKKARRAGTCVGVAVEFAGDVCGVAYLVGRPAVDADRQEIGLADLEFSVDTTDAMVRAASWLARGAFVERVAREARVSLASATSDARARLHQALRGKLAGDWRLSGSADTVAIQVGVGSTGLDYAIDLSGTLAVSLSAP